MSIVRIALANLTYPTSPDDSIARAVDAIERAAQQEASVVCFPECYVPGYRTADRPQPPADREFLTRAWATVAEAAARSHITVVLGTERFVGDKLRITAMVFGPDGTVVGMQDKMQLDPSEDNGFMAGDTRRVFQAGALTFGVAICHEGLRYPETVRWAARRGAHVVFLPHFEWATPGSFRPTEFADPRNTFHEKAIICRAAENTCYVAAVNYASEGSPTTSAIVRPDATVQCIQPYGEEGLLVADIDITLATRLLAMRCRSDFYAG